MDTLRIASRKSRLAMRQTEMTLELLQQAYPDRHFEVLPMSTKGDEKLKWSLEKVGGKGLFTSELEKAIVAKEADLAVHSAKDLPTEVPEGLVIAGYLPRESMEDVLVLREGVSHPKLIATSSPRRRAQLAHIYPDAEWTEIRGNVETRMRKILDGLADATVLARAGLNRLGISEYAGLIFKPLPIEQSVPAAGQGAIALQCRSEDASFFDPILCRKTATAVDIERSVLASLGGGCQSASAVAVESEILHLFHESLGYKTLEIQADGSINGIDELIEEIDRQA